MANKLIISLNNILPILSILLILIPNAYPTNPVITPYDSPICQRPQKSSKIQLYSHNIYTGPNQALYEVANASISDTSPSQFGVVRVFDIKLTRDPDYNSQELGRTQGITSNVDLRVLANGLYTNVLFTSDDEYRGSTITILGRSERTEYRELSVVGGTGIFRCARGYLIATTYSFDAATNSSVLYDEFYVDYGS